jgi:hypothetical protein
VHLQEIEIRIERALFEWWGLKSILKGNRDKDRNHII